MTYLRSWLPALVVLAAGVLPAAAAPALKRDASDPQSVADRIDHWIAARLQQQKVSSAELCDDATFLRRASLDIAGIIPPVADVRRFLADRSPDKRARAVERLLASPGYVTHFTDIWRKLLVPEAEADFQRQFIVPGMEAWIRQQFRDNVAYNRMVRELLTVSFQGNTQAAAYAVYNTQGPAPISFYRAKEGKPENLAASVARLFMGVRIECAQCHDHPFGRWKREQFWGQAAFFAGIRTDANGGFFGQFSEVFDRRELSIPNTERVAQASFLDDKEPRWKYKTSARATLADWLTATDNPFFARAAANRMWAHFFGIGLVDPVDDFNDDNLPSHPELLDELAREFAQHKFDFKFLIRAITLSRAYQLSSTHPSRPDARLFASMPVKGLTGEQVLDSFLRATGLGDGGRPMQRSGFNSQYRDFLVRFNAQEKRTEYHTAIPQALALMNGNLASQATDPENGPTLSAVLNSPFLDDAGRIETLYLAALGRRPRPDESARFLEYVKAGGPKKSSKAALSDVFWALLNSPEFLFNR
jgi:hypothetical protein